MTNPKNDILDALYTILSGNIVYGASSINYYTIPPEDTPLYYAVLTDIFFNPWSTKNRDYYDVTFTIDTITNYKFNGSYTLANYFDNKMLMGYRLKQMLKKTLKSFCLLIILCIPATSKSNETHLKCMQVKQLSRKMNQVQ